MFIFIFYAGVYGGRSEMIINLWNKEKGRPIFGATRSRNRFQQITRVMCFDKRDTRAERRERDKLAPIRNIHDKFAAKCRGNY